MPGWGGGSGGGWGGEGWGGGGSFATGPSPIVRVVAIAENVVRVYFGAAPYLSGLLDPSDASLPGLWTVAPAVGSPTGLDGNAPRPVNVLSVAAGTEEASIDLTLDRPMTPWPAQYVVSETGLAYGGPPSLLPIPPASATFPAVFKQLVAPDPDAFVPSRDFANPQSASDQNTSSTLLGTYPVDDTGDYAVDQGLPSYRKRVLRRLITRKNGFAHLPGYGVGIQTYGKKLQKASVRAAIAADAEAQIAQEPETAQVTVTSRQDAITPGLVYFVVSAKTKSGANLRFAVPFPTA